MCIRDRFHSDQGWQYQHSEYQRLLSEHNIVQSMSRKGNCMDNGAMENFFGRLKVEMFYGEKFESVKAFIDELKRYIDYYNNERISLKLKGMSPVQMCIRDRHLVFNQKRCLYYEKNINSGIVSSFIVVNNRMRNKFRT